MNKNKRIIVCSIVSLLLLGLAVLVLFGDKPVKEVRRLDPPQSAEDIMISTEIMNKPESKNDFHDLTVAITAPVVALEKVTEKTNAKKSRLETSYGVKNVTHSNSVRKSELSLGADYKVSDRNTLGVAFKNQRYDRSDASVWRKKEEDGKAAQVKYTLSF